MNQLEALIAIGTFFVLLLIIVMIILLYALRDQKIERQQDMMKMNVIIDNLIDIVTTQKYGTDEED
jgi:hypothetical protein